MRSLMLLLPAILALGACDRSEPTPKPKAKAPAATPTVAFDAAFNGVAGSWRSEPGSAGPGRFVQIDVASGGGFTAEVREGVPGKLVVLEEARGTARMQGDRILGAFSGKPRGGSVLSSLGRVEGQVVRVSGDAGGSMSISGGGKTYALKYAGR